MNIKFNCCFGLILYLAVNNLSVMFVQVIQDCTCTKQSINCFALGHNIVQHYGRSFATY